MEEINNNTEQFIQSPQPNQPPEQQISTPSQKDKNIYKVLFFVSILILLVVVIISYLLIQTNNKQKISDSNQTLETTIIPTTKEKESTPTQTTVKTPDAEKTLLDLQKNLKTNAPIKEIPMSFHNDWILGDERVPLLTKGFSLVRKGYNDDSSVWGNFTSIEEITEESLKPFKKLINDFFISNNFAVDDENTYKLGRYEDNFGYTKGDLKCSVKLSYQSDPFSQIYCGAIDQNQLKLRQEVSSAFNSTKDKDVAFHVNKLIGNSAQGGMGSYSGGGGAAWIAAKINGRWELVYSGQDVTSCDIMDKYNVSKEVYGSCYDTEKQELRK